MSEQLVGGGRAGQRMLACGVCAGPLFVATFTALARTRAGYDSRRHPVSALAAGRGGSAQRLNFALTGVSYLAGAGGLALAPRRLVGSRVTPALVGAAALGLIGSGYFVTDPVSGFPPGTDGATVSPSREGTLHNLGAIPIFLGIPLAQLLSARAFAKQGQGGWARYSTGSAVVMVISAALSGAAFGQTRALVAWGGLLQRVSIVTGFGWLTALSLKASRR